MSQLGCSIALTNTQWWRHHLSVLPPSPISNSYKKRCILGTVQKGCHYLWVILSPLTWWHLFWMAPKIHLFWYEFATSQRCHVKDVFLEMYSIRRKNVSKRHLSWDAFEASQRRRKKDVFFETYLRCLKDVSKKTPFLRCLSQRRPDWDVSETSHIGWVVSQLLRGCNKNQFFHLFGLLHDMLRRQDLPNNWFERRLKLLAMSLSIFRKVVSPSWFYCSNTQGHFELTLGILGYQ